MSSAPTVKGLVLSEIRTIVLTSVARLGKRTLSVTNHGRWYIRLENRTCDVEYEIPLLSAPLWMQHLTDDHRPATLSVEV
jgi:hypothetical protein